MAAFVKFFLKPTGTAVAGVLPPLIVYVTLWDLNGIDISGPCYLLVAVGISTTTVLIWTEAWLSHRRFDPPEHPPGEPWPEVSAIIAAYLPNEYATIFDTMEAFVRMDYPGPMQVIVAYNTRNDMPEVEDALHDFARRHPGFEILRLFGSTSKAENVNRAVRHVRGAVIGVFDADHWPAPDSFRRAVQWIIDGRMDVVQGRCVVRNGGQSLMSKLVAVEFEQIYGVAHPGRARMHGFGIFGGTNGFWRTSVLRTVKFDESMLTEDIDSGLRALRAGHRLHSDPYLVSYELATATLASFWSQRMRWAQGWFQASLRHTLPLATDRRLTKRQRAGAVHLFFWREVYPWLALQMWPIIFFWVHRYGLFRIDWTVLPWIALTFINLLTGPVLILFAWYSAHPSVRKEWRWFALSMLLAPFFSELKNGLCRVAQFKQLRGGKHEWVVTPRDVAPAARPAGS